MLGRASELALPTLNRMVRLFVHNSLVDLFVPIVPVDAAVLAGAGGAGAAATVADAGVAAVNASDGVACADDALMLQFHHFHVRLHIYLLHNAVLLLFDYDFTSVVHIHTALCRLAAELASAHVVPRASLIRGIRAIRGRYSGLVAEVQHEYLDIAVASGVARRAAVEGGVAERHQGCGCQLCRHLFGGEAEGQRQRVPRAVLVERAATEGDAVGRLAVVTGEHRSVVAVVGQAEVYTCSGRRR